MLGASTQENIRFIYLFDSTIAALPDQAEAK